MTSAFPPSIINRQKILDQLWKRSSTFPNPLTPQPAPMEKTRLFAVLVGINKYECSERDFPTLRGAVADAHGFQSYLENVLGIPSTQVVVLTDENATRSAIIGALKDLREDDRIDPGDAILIYYAGHGTEMDPPINWESGGPNAQIQAIVPYDCDVIKSGQRVAPIPDRVLEVLLASIADKKGDNITVILDCCHSASGTRAIRSDGVSQARSVVLPSRVYPEQLDSDILDSVPGVRGNYTSSKFRYRGLGSHVLLAACSATQLAIERNGHGRFSAALLKLLKQVPLDKLRYSDIITHPSLDRFPDQDPVCEGLNVDRTLFNAKVLPVRPKVFPVSYNKSANHKHGQYVVHAGTIHNITTDCEFAVYRESDVQFVNQIGILHVDKLRPFSFLAKVPPEAPRFDLAHPTVAIQSSPRRKEDLRIRIPPNDGFIHIYHDLAENQVLKNDVECISLVDESQDAHVEIKSPHKDAVEFTMHTPSAGDVASHKFSHVVDVENLDVLAGILSKMAHFYRELICVDNGPEISRYIDIEFYKLRPVYETDEGAQIQEERLEPFDPDLYVKGCINVLVPGEEGDEIPYGMKITNRSGNHLHANLFYFNNHDLSITACVKPHTSFDDKALDVPLRSHGGSLTIGYGAAGYQPLCFEINNGDFDVGFLKIYLSTQPVKMIHVPQSSPFSSTRALTHYRGRKQRPLVSWTDIIIPIIQQRQH